MGRVANLPTVVSNVMLGCGLGIYARSWELEVWRLVVPCVVGCLLYLGGCLLNDWWDRNWDAKNKPDRPVPMGRINEKALFWVAVTCLILGVGTSVLLGKWVVLVALAIVGSIVLYTAIHKKTAWGVLPMGLCRGLLYVLGFMSQVWIFKPSIWGLAAGKNGPEFVPKSAFIESSFRENILNQMGLIGLPSIGLICFVAGLSMFARAESQPIVPRINVVVGVGLMSLVAFTHSTNWMPYYPLWNVVSLVPFFVLLIWGIIQTKKNVGAGVSWLLATIALVDLVIMLPMMISFSSGSVDLSFPIQEVFIFPTVSILAFCLALLLQRIAPAT